jgi:hypothetical protein
VKHCTQLIFWGRISLNFCLGSHWTSSSWSLPPALQGYRCEPPRLTCIHFWCGSYLRHGDSSVVKLKVWNYSLASQQCPVLLIPAGNLECTCWCLSLWAHFLKTSSYLGEWQEWGTAAFPTLFRFQLLVMDWTPHQPPEMRSRQMQYATKGALDSTSSEVGDGRTWAACTQEKYLSASG